MKPYRHAVSSAKKWGGAPEEYLDIHQFLDSSKSAVADVRHRALTHNTWFLSVVLEKVFGVTRTNSVGRVYCVRDIGEQHVAEDYGGFIPSAQDFVQEIELQDWMQNGRGVSPSCARFYRPKRKRHDENQDRAGEVAGVCKPPSEDQGAAVRPAKSLVEQVREFLGQFDEDDFERWFGENAKIKVDREKGVVVEDYDCGH